MNKVLLGTTVLVSSLAVAPGAAFASDPVKLTLGGYMEYWVAAGSQDSAYSTPVNSFDIQGDSRIFFTGKTTLDNGMKVGAQVEIAAGADSNDTEVVRSYAWVQGNAGKMIVGKYRDVVWMTHNEAPDASYLTAGLTKSDFVAQITPRNQVFILDPNETPTNYANKLSYFTPSVYGFQAGVSFTPSNDVRGDDYFDTTDGIEKTGNFDQAWATSLSYGGEVAGVGVKAAVGYDYMNGRNDAEVANPGNVHNFQTSGALSYQGFTVGGSFNRMIAGEDSFNAAKDGHAWELGLGYAEGPYAVSFSYAHSSVRGIYSGDDTAGLYRVGARYTLGPGVDLFSSVGYFDAESGSGDASKGNEGAWGGAAGLRLTF